MAIYWLVAETKNIAVTEMALHVGQGHAECATLFRPSRRDVAERDHFTVVIVIGRCYRIIRFRFDGRPRTVRTTVTLAEAQEHCSRPDTSSHSTGPGAWFDGYDYMPGCRPKETA